MINTKKNPITYGQSCKTYFVSKNILRYQFVSREEFFSETKIFPHELKKKYYFHFMVSKIILISICFLCLVLFLGMTSMSFWERIKCIFPGNFLSLCNLIFIWS